MLKDKLLSVERNSVWVLLPILFTLFGFALGVISMSSVGGCSGFTEAHSPVPYLLAGIAGAGLVSGHVLGYVRRWLHDDPSPYKTGVKTEPWLQGLLVLLLTVATGALLYESYGTFPTTGAEAITQYVRCAAVSHPWLTGATSYFVFLLIGSWLWYPTVGPSARPRFGDQSQAVSDPPTSEAS